MAYQWRPGWFVSLRGTLHTGWPTTPVTGLSVTLPAYARLDMKTGRDFATSKGSVRVDEVQLVPGPLGHIDAKTSYDYWMGITPSFQVAWSF